MESDSADLDKISPNLSCGNIHSPDSSLSELVTGVVTGEGVNVHENESVSCKPMQDIFGQLVR